MVDKIQKVLDKLSLQEKEWIKSLLFKIKNNDLLGLDLKKLKGHEDIFRVRKGKIRVIYRLQNGQIKLLAIERRNDNTYREF